MNPAVRHALARLEQMAGSPLRQYRDAINDELCELTQSSISYFAAMNLDETILTMIGWSKSAMGMCATMTKPLVYMLEDTGIWGDAVRERTYVITNDYQNLIKPTKKGYPAGHVEVTRHMNLPIFDSGRIVLVVGVGNKPTDYTLEDVRNVQDLMNTAWATFQQTLWAETF